jgi:class 3 adenylate cyclase
MSETNSGDAIVLNPDLFNYHFGKRVEQSDVESRLDTRVSGVHVLLIDLCSYSAFVRETPELAIATEMLRSFCDRSRDVVLASGGAVDRVTGDAVMAFWGLTDDVEYRVPLETSFHLLEIADEVSAEWQEEIDQVISPRGASAGLTYGEVAFMRMSDAYAGFSMLGDSVNLAARLESLAEPGALFISNRFRNLIRHDEDAGIDTGLDIEEVDDGDDLEGIVIKNMGSVHAFRVRPRG